MEPNCRQKHTDAGISLFWDAPPKHQTAAVIQLMDPGEIKTLKHLKIRGRNAAEKAEISPMFGCLSNLQILASLSSFWWSRKQPDCSFTSHLRLGRP